MDILHHDLSNPLSAVRSAATLLEEQVSLAPELLPIIRRNIAKAQDLLDNARRYTHLENVGHLDPVELDLGGLLRGVVEDCGAAAREAGVGIELVIGEEPLRLLADPLLKMVFTNLLANALRYAAGSRRVSVEAHREVGGCRVTVRDSGPGIDDAYKSTIFDRFSRRDKAGIKGSGLGLAIARRITELHGGTIRVEDNPGGGALFTVLLPTHAGDPAIA